MTGGKVRLAHGNGGRWTRELVEEVFLRAFGPRSPGELLDATPLDLVAGRWALTTDGFVVSPPIFPGGSIGSLAIHGTCNDLASLGAIPRFASASFILEEGFDIGLLGRLAVDMAEAARDAGLPVVAGDTKVVERGKGDGLFVSMSGFGYVPEGRSLSPSRIRPGDAWIVTGPVGDHGAAIVAARGDYALDAPILSDSANLSPLVEALLGEVPSVRFLRDATRGGFAQVIVEASRAGRVGAVLEEGSVPVRPAVEGLCDILGFDPLYLACEGRLVACVPEEDVGRALGALRSHPLGLESSLVGRVVCGEDVSLKTLVGGERLLEELEEDSVPRIC